MAFILMDPKAMIPDYKVELRPHELSELAVNSPDELQIYTMVVVPQDRSKVRTNLKAPILISPKHRLGKQTILDRSDYPVQFFLARAQSAQDQSQEVSHARSDA